MVTVFATYKPNEYKLEMQQQSLHHIMRNINAFNPGSNVNCFITDLNQAYMIHIKPEFATYPRMEEEFIKIAK